jgi:predicted nucleic acid-binding protein
MRVVVADTGPLRYLPQIGEIELLPRLFDKIFIPSIVSDELRHPSAPESVRTWIDSKPGWLEISVVAPSDDPSLNTLDPGEKAAIALGVSLSADLLLINDRRGVAVARSKGLEVIGTLGVLDLGARRGMVDLNKAIARLRTTNFRRREELFDALLKRHGRD